MKNGIIGVFVGILVTVAGAWLYFTQYSGLRSEQNSNDGILDNSNQVEADQCNNLETPVEQLACRVSEVAIVLAQTRMESGLSDSEYMASEFYKRFAAAKATEYIQTYVSSARFSREKTVLGVNFTTPVDANDALARGIGICGNQIAVFLAVMDELNIENRAIQFWYEYEPGVRRSHIGAEIFDGDDWNYFDVTWGAYFTNSDGSEILSIDEVMDNDERVMSLNEMNVWFQYGRDVYGLDGVFAYLYRDADITINYEGDVRAYDIELDDGAYAFPLLDIPNYVGDNKADGSQAGIRYLFDVPVGTYEVEIEMVALAGCDSTDLFINDTKVNFQEKQASLIIDCLTSAPMGPNSVI